MQKRASRVYLSVEDEISLNEKIQIFRTIDRVTASENFFNYFIGHPEFILSIFHFSYSKLETRHGENIVPFPIHFSRSQRDLMTFLSFHSRK